MAIKEKPASALKKQAPGAIPKTINLKTTSSAIQALKKKYQEQRLTKQRLKKKFKPTCMKTRSCVDAIERAAENKPLPVKFIEAPKKIMSRMENKRHGLRSTGPADTEKMALLPLKSLKKQLPLKLKKNSLARDEAPSVDTMPARNGPRKATCKLNAAKPIQKKLFGKSKKLEGRRVTRSRTDAPASPPPVNLPRRPTRKTKEAAAVYMEILGRKLVSPELENEDNMSLDSFPELPNARKIAQTENEIKAKVKSLKAAASIAAAASAAPASSTLSATTAKDKEKKTCGSARYATLNSSKPCPLIILPTFQSTFQRFTFCLVTPLSIRYYPPNV
jgi:hypothetical protein